MYHKRESSDLEPYLNKKKKKIAPFIKDNGDLLQKVIVMHNFFYIFEGDLCTFVKMYINVWN